MHGWLPMALLAGMTPGVSAQETLTVRATSPRRGLLFTDSEPVDVSVTVGNATGPVRVEYSVSESEGPWQQIGHLRLGDRATRRLPLTLPGRGLYRLVLTARDDRAAAEAETWIAVVFTPEAPDPASPWGIFYAPDGTSPDNPQRGRDLAVSHRLLGASWSRFNFWAFSFGEVTVTEGPNPRVMADYSLWKALARGLRDEGISILGEIAQCPRELSSRPNEAEQQGDAGPVYNRVRPADYALWDQLMEQVAADFREEIGVWEIWNEANLPDLYWTGTVEDFAELVRHTSAALRRGNPDARIAAAGFVGGHDFAARLLELGMGEDIDILSVHYTDEHPEWINQWSALLKQHSLDLPIWNTEERSEIPLRNLSGPVERSFKFIHVEIGYPDYRPLVRKDLTVLPAGVRFSVGAHCIGTAKFARVSDQVPGWETRFFQRGEETVVSFDRAGSGPFETGVPTVTLAVTPLIAGRAPTLTDTWGRSRRLPLRDGRCLAALVSAPAFLNGCRSVEVIDATSEGSGGLIVAEAEKGRWSPGWIALPKEGFSGGATLDLWSDGDPGEDGYWIEVDLDVPAEGRYEVIFSGNSLSRLKTPRSLSPFIWRLDGGEEHLADGALPALGEYLGLTESPTSLGEVTLTHGKHTFRLMLTDRREAPDQNWALWVDAIVLRRTQQGD
jgi:hypothetical protein